MSASLLQDDEGASLPLCHHSAVELPYDDRVVCVGRPGHGAEVLVRHRHASYRLLRCISRHTGISVGTSPPPVLDDRTQDSAGHGHCTWLVVEQQTIRNAMPWSKDLVDFGDHSSSSGLATHELDLCSKIAAKDIGAMLLYLVRIGSAHFLQVFEDCIQPVDLNQVTHNNTYREFLGTPLEQTVPNTCAIVSSTMCVEVHHRWEYETLHETRTFPCIAASPRKLRSACRRAQSWDPKEGAYVGDVMLMIRQLGGVRTTNAPTPAPSFLPLHSWQRHRWDIGHGLTADHIMELLDTRGPFVGTLWVCPWFHLFDAAEDEDFVYRSGCARNEELQKFSRQCFGKINVGRHSVLCFEYRICNGQLEVLILDNHAPNGPERWIHFYELEEVHTISVERMHLGGRTITYPHSGARG